MSNKTMPWINPTMCGFGYPSYVHTYNTNINSYAVSKDVSDLGHPRPDQRPSCFELDVGRIVCTCTGLGLFSAIITRRARANACLDTLSDGQVQTSQQI